MSNGCLSSWRVAASQLLANTAVREDLARSSKRFTRTENLNTCYEKSI